MVLHSMSGYRLVIGTIYESVMIRFILALPLLLLFAMIMVQLRIILWPYFYMYGWLAPWIFGGSIVLLIVLQLIFPSKEEDEDV